MAYTIPLIFFHVSSHFALQANFCLQRKSANCDMHKLDTMHYLGKHKRGFALHDAHGSR